MIYLIAVSLIWAYSFGLIKGHLTGLDASVVAAIRLLLAWLVFLPFSRLRQCRPRLLIGLLIIGAIQYGVMYMAYTESFHYLQAYQVALFTIFTPIYVTVINDLFSKQFHQRFFIAATLAVIGTAIILYRDLHHDEFRTGFLLLQLANFCFAFGQVAYTRLMRHTHVGDLQVFSWLYLGALLSTLPMLWSRGQWHLPSLSLNELSALLYLGVLASGLCFFWWNFGARKVNAGTLAVCNNLKIPLAIACSALVFGETVNWQQLAIGSAILLLAFTLNWRGWRRR